MTALTIAQKAAGRLGIPVPTVLFSSTDAQIIQLRSLMNQGGLELAAAKDWVVLQTQAEFTTVATAVQSSAIPSDFDHFMNNSMWDRTTDRPVYGPLNAQEWQREKAGPTFTSVYYAFRIRGTDMLFTPTPTAGDDVFYEYVTNQWCTSSGGTGQTAFAADTDLAKLPEELHVLDLIWRFKSAKGLSFDAEFASFQMQVEQAAARSGGAPVLNMALSMPYRRYQPNIPEGNWPSSP